MFFYFSERTILGDVGTGYRDQGDKNTIFLQFRITERVQNGEKNRLRFSGNFHRVYPKSMAETCHKYNALTSYDTIHYFVHTSTVQNYRETKHVFRTLPIGRGVVKGEEKKHPIQTQL